MPTTMESIENTGKRGTARKAKAILAGGLVLGLGAAITLAAWNDSEFARGDFASGQFNLEGSLNGTDYSDHDVAGAPAVLSFTVSPDNLAPGDVVSAPFAVRLDAATSYDATVTVSHEGSTGTLTGLTYSIIQPTAFGCESAGAATLVPAGTALGTVPASTTFDLSQGADTAAGAPEFLCFVVTAGAGLTQGQSGTVTWKFTAESDA